MDKADIEKQSEIAHEKQFHMSRKMFYFDAKSGDIRFPSDEYRNMSHKQWFNDIKVDIKKVIRGFYDGYDVYLYIGDNFDIPNISINQILQLQYIFKINSVYLGMNIGTIGTIWSPKMEIAITELNTKI